MVLLVLFFDLYRKHIVFFGKSSSLFLQEVVLDVVKYDDQHQKCWIKREVEHFSDRRLNKSWRRLEVPRERGVHDRSLEWPTVGR